MAQFTTKGLSGLQLSLSELANLPEGVPNAMLKAAGRIVVNCQQQRITQLGLVSTGKLRASVTAGEPKRAADKGGRFVLVFPQGVHDSIRRKKGKVRTISNSALGFIHEFGAPRRNLKASKWMSSANANAAAGVIAAEERIYNDYLNKLGL